MKSFDQKKPQDVIVRFVGFGLVLSVPKLLHPSMEGFEVPKAVGKLVLNKSRKASVSAEVKGEGMSGRWLLNLVYCLFKWFFVSFYYYFFPMVVIFTPLFKITYLVDVQN